MSQSLLVLQCDWLEKQQKIAAQNSMRTKRDFETQTRVLRGILSGKL